MRSGKETVKLIAGTEIDKGCCVRCRQEGGGAETLQILSSCYKQLSQKDDQNLEKQERKKQLSG